MKLSWTETNKKLRRFPDFKTRQSGLKLASVGPRFRSSLLWLTLESERSRREEAAVQLHNLLLTYVIKISLKLVR